MSMPTIELKAVSSMARTTSRVDSLKQLKVGRLAKSARKKEAGLDGQRVGKATATTRRAQARRDSKGR
jgi:hypothetical protein